MARSLWPPTCPTFSVRRSARIPKQIPILLIGSDLDGRMFSERTTTVLLSLHGAGILSCHKLSPEQELILRWTEKNKETDIRIVGQIGEQAGLHTYGAAFFDQNLNFWEIDFPPISDIEKQLGFTSLRCSSCGALEKIDDTSVEADVCATNDSVLRSCKRCGATTLWTPPPGPPLALVAALSASTNAAALPLPPPVQETPAAARINRRKHPRVQVHYSACIRNPQRADDIVTCEDMSKGGLRFTSRQQYYVRSFIEVAVPYQPGQPAIFVPAQIVFVEELPEQTLFRCAVQYLKSTSPRGSFYPE